MELFSPSFKFSTDILLFGGYGTLFDDTTFPGDTTSSVLSNSILVATLFSSTGTQEFELRSIEFKKYISGLRSIFWFPKEA